MPIAVFRTLYDYRDLLFAWTGRVIRARYQQSILGGLWAIVQPAATVAIFTVLFTRFLRVDTGNTPYVIFSYAAMVPWTLFSSSITDMVESLVTNMNLVTKIYFPRDILVIAAMLARLVDFAIAFSILLLMIALYQMEVNVPGLLLLPVLLATQLALALGIGLIGAAVNVFYRDVKHLVALGLQMWLYATPIIYPSTLVPEHLQSLYFLNPMAGVIQGYRAVLLRGDLPTPYLGLSIVVAIGVLVFGFWFFKRMEHQFADVV